MKFLLLLFLAMPCYLYGQFGFERSDDIEVYKNNIQQKFAWVGGLDYCSFSNVDFNMDGVSDLFIFDKSGNKPLTFIQNGSNGQIDFEYAPQYESAFPKDIRSWALMVDYDNDGKKDLFTSGYGGAVVYKNTSNATNGFELTALSPAGLYTTYTFSGTVSNPVNVFISQGDIPAISDIDNDGDVDILSFSNSTSCIQYHKNMSQEIYGNSDTLLFKTVNVCYGNMAESNISNLIVVDTCCQTFGAGQVDNPEDIFDNRPSGTIEDRDPGSTLLSIDLDADGMQDLIIGDVLTGNLVRVMNDGQAPNTNIDLVSPDYLFPSYDLPVNIPVFPAAYYVDLNNDGIRDLVVSPNNKLNSHNYNATWMYLNDNLDDNPDFEFQTNGFLQTDMIDGGSESYPVFFDYNGDGLMDLFVSISGRFDSLSQEKYSQILHYQNNGTANNPEFHLVSEDFMNLSNFNNVNHEFYRPAFGDADGDGDKDLLLSEMNDTMYYFENSAGVGNVAQFINPTAFKNSNGQVINEGNFISPKFVDLDRDGREDLVLGKRNGQLSYYKNVGSTNAYSFEFVTATLGDVNVSEYWTILGKATPEFIDIDNEWHLICGAENGYLHYYDQIDGNIGGSFNLYDSTLHDIYTGKLSNLAIADIDGDNRFEMLVGNERGGLSSFKSAVITDVGLNSAAVRYGISVYPNPAENVLFIDLSKLPLQSYPKRNYTLLDVSGKTVLSNEIVATKTAVNTERLANGIYFLSINLNGELINHKIVIN